MLKTISINKRGY